jgi:hypothetical protein
MASQLDPLFLAGTMAGPAVSIADAGLSGVMFISASPDSRGAETNTHLDQLDVPSPERERSRRAMGCQASLLPRSPSREAPKSMISLM